MTTRGRGVFAATYLDEIAAAPITAKARRRSADELRCGNPALLKDVRVAS
jgi:hypothetical protein